MDNEEIGVTLKILEHGQEENNNLIRDMSVRYEEHLVLGRLFQAKTEEELKEMKEVVKWAQEKRVSEKDKAEFYRDLKKRIATKGIMSVLIGLVVLLGYGLKVWLRGEI